MEVPRDSMLMRIFIGESDRWNHKPLYEAIVLKAREMHLGGATVLRGPMGFGKSSRMHTAKILRLSMDLPIVIEIVDVSPPHRFSDANTKSLRHQFLHHKTGREMARRELH